MPSIVLTLELATGTGVLLWQEAEYPNIDIIYRSRYDPGVLIICDMWYSNAAFSTSRDRFLAYHLRRWRDTWFHRVTLARARYAAGIRCICARRCGQRFFWRRYAER